MKSNAVGSQAHRTRVFLLHLLCVFVGYRRDVNRYRESFLWHYLAPFSPGIACEHAIPLECILDIYQGYNLLTLRESNQQPFCEPGCFACKSS